jgi:hypothetical protein
MIMSIKLNDTVNIAGHFLPALVNDDTSGLSVEDSKALIRWTISNPLLAAGILDVKGEPSFERDIVTGLLSDCYEVDVYIDDQWKGAK